MDDQRPSPEQPRHRQLAISVLLLGLIGGSGVYGYFRLSPSPAITEPEYRQQEGLREQAINESYRRLLKASATAAPSPSPVPAVAIDTSWISSPELERWIRVLDPDLQQHFTQLIDHLVTSLANGSRRIAAAAMSDEASVWCEMSNIFLEEMRYQEAYLFESVAHELGVPVPRNGMILANLSQEDIQEVEQDVARIVSILETHGTSPASKQAVADVIVKYLRKIPMAQ